MKKHNSQGMILYCVILVLMNCVPVRVVMGHTNSSSSNNTSTSTMARLKIAVPVRGFNDFVTVDTDPNTGKPIISGFAVEVFKAAAPPSLLFELVPVNFIQPDGTLNGTYDDLLKNVSSQFYGGAVGDISLVYNRTQWVDFTLPYLETDISMLVPKKQQNQTLNTTKIPLRRVTKYFVVATLAFSLIVAVVFWVMEHKNDNYASQPRPTNLHPPLGQYDDDWRREILRSVIQTRLVMVLLFMVLLVLTACYAASQTSFLVETRKTSAPMTNLNQLIRAKKNVGYQQGSFIKDLLTQKGISESNLIHFGTDAEMFNLLTQGGIAAVVGLTPHLKLRQGNHCDAYAIVPTFNLHAAGFGFAFPKGSPLVQNVSTGILKIIYNGKLGKIQDTTIGSFDKCPDDPNGETSSGMIDRDTLWILVAGAIGVLILIVIMMLVHCGITCNTKRKKNNKAVAYPCYMLPCC